MKERTLADYTKFFSYFIPGSRRRKQFRRNYRDNFSYLRLYWKYFFQYWRSKDKVELDFFEVWVGQRCTLKCKHCLHLMPYLKKHNLYDIDELIKDIKKIQKIANIKHLSIAGGEPFTHPYLYKLLDFVYSNKDIQESEVVSNATIVPDTQSLDLLKKLNGKLYIRVDVYPGNEKRGDEFLSVCRNYGIDCRVLFYPDKNNAKWYNAGTPDKKINSVQRTKEVYQACFIKHCNSMADGIFVPCCRGIITEQIYGFPANKFENLNIRKLKANAFGKASLAVATNQLYWKDFCRYCDGVSFLAEEVTPGIQLN